MLLFHAWHFFFTLNGFLITSQDDGLSTLDSFQANSIDCIDYSLNRERSWIPSTPCLGENVENKIPWLYPPEIPPYGSY